MKTYTEEEIEWICKKRMAQMLISVAEELVKVTTIEVLQKELMAMTIASKAILESPVGASQEDVQKRGRGILMDLIED